MSKYIVGSPEDGMILAAPNGEVFVLDRQHWRKCHFGLISSKPLQEAEDLLDDAKPNHILTGPETEPGDSPS